MAERETEVVRTEVDDEGIAVLTLDQPSRRNALDLDMSRALAAAVETVVAADAAAIILTAAPPVFCAGGSLDDLLTPRAPLAETYAGFLALAGAPVVTIAVVAGPAVGAGVNLPLACDIVLTTPAARFDPRFLDLGIHPGGGHLFRLAERVGRQGAAALTLAGDTLDGQEAVDHGLAWRCVADDEALPLARTLAARVASRPRELMRRSKAALDESLATGSAADAMAIELEVQQWSVEQPEFRRRVEAMQARLAQRER